MLRSAFWIDQMSRMIYVAILILSWFQALYFIYPRFDIPVLPDGAILWLFIVIGSYTLVISHLTKKLQPLCFLLFAIIGILSGYLLYEDLVTSIILILSLTSLTYRAVLKGIGRKEIISLWMASLIFFGFLFLLSYFMQLTEGEISRLIYFLFITLVLALFGASVSQLNHFDQQMSMKEMIRQWGIHNRWLWGSLAVILVAGIVLLSVIVVAYFVARWLIIVAITPFVKWFFTDFFNWLQKKYEQAQNEMLNIEMQPPGEDNIDVSDYLEVAEVSPFWDAFWNVFITLGFIALVVIVIYYLTRFIKRNIFKKIESTPIDKKQIAELKTIAQEKDRYRLKDIFSNLFTKRDIDELHEVRKDFRELLKLLRQKGYYSSDSMTVQQINRMIQDLRVSSTLYERLRYGDQNLTNEEIRVFKVEIQKIKSELLRR